MYNYKAYELGGQIPYPVTQIRWEGNKKFIAFNSQWYSEDECVLCAGSGVYDMKRGEIYDGDIIQLKTIDKQQQCGDGIGHVFFSEGSFYWTPKNHYRDYLLASKSWVKLGNVNRSGDLIKYYTDDEIKKSYNLRESQKRIKDFYHGVLIEKYSFKKDSQFISKTSENSQKMAKKLLHQYKNYLKIKDLIDMGKINTDILNSNLG